MAIPSLQNNTPSPGHITWGAFTIQLYGVAYGVPAASSDQRWVWWEYKAGVPILNSGPEVPNTLTDDDLVLFANKNGIGVRVQSTSFVDGELLVDGSIFAAALSTNLINSNHIVTAGLDAGVIKFGEMHGDRIQADTIGATQIAARSITALEIAAATITSSEIATGSITADKIAAEAITAEHLLGKYIEGATLDIPDSIFAEPGFLDIKAQLMEAESAIFHDNVTRRGLNNYITGRETASSGVTRPGTPPTVTNTWPTLQTAIPGNINGLTQGYSSTEWVGVFSPSGMVIAVYDTVTGAHKRDLVTGSSGMKTTYDICRAGDWYYVLERDFMATSIVCRRYDARTGATEGTRDTSYQFTALDDSTLLANPSAMGMTSDGTNLFMVWINQNGRYRIKKQTISGKANNVAADYDTLPSDMSPSNGNQAGIAGLDVSTLSTTNVVNIQPYHGPQVVTSNFSGPWTTQDTRKRDLPFGRTVVGASGERTMDVDGRMYTHSASYIGTRPYTYTWYDADTAGAGVAETLASPPRSFVIAKGAYVNIKTPLPPDDGTVDAPNTVRVYVDDFLQGSHYTEAELASGRTLVAPSLSGNPSPLESGFASRPQTLPGGYKSTAGDANGPLWWLYGDGSGRIGPWQWDSTGAMVKQPSVSKTESISFNGSGIATITHNLGVIPKGVSVQQAGQYNNNLVFKVQSRNINTVTLSCTNINTNVDVTSASRDVSWTCSI